MLMLKTRKAKALVGLLSSRPHVGSGQLAHQLFHRDFSWAKIMLVLRTRAAKALVGLFSFRPNVGPGQLAHQLFHRNFT
jgi:hypothetical protein